VNAGMRECMNEKKKRQCEGSPFRVGAAQAGMRECRNEKKKKNCAMELPLVLG